VLETRRSRGDPDLGILRWRCQLYSVDATGVLDLENTLLFDLKESA
jgi:hypothetical protein